jgi:hypothetical protein
LVGERQKGLHGGVWQNTFLFAYPHQISIGKNNPFAAMLSNEPIQM